MRPAPRLASFPHALSLHGVVDSTRQVLYLFGDALGPHGGSDALGPHGGSGFLSFQRQALAVATSAQSCFLPLRRRARPLWTVRFHRHFPTTSGDALGTLGWTVFFLSGVRPCYRPLYPLAISLPLRRRARLYGLSVFPATTLWYCTLPKTFSRHHLRYYFP